MKTTSLLRLAVVTLLLTTFTLYSQDLKKEEKKEGKVPHEFKIVKQIETTPVESQDRTGCCWSFATTSFLETELMRMGKGDVQLSEMFFVRQTYPVKGESYRRYHGMANFGQGALSHDVINAVRKYGMVPKAVYNPKVIDGKKYNHSEMESMLKSILDVAVKKRSGKLTPQSNELFNAALDIYMGPVPTEFEYEGKTYTPASFRDMLGINPDDYVELTSFTHHPFYEAFDLEVPDNISRASFYNIPIDELVAVIDNAIENGYSVAWDGDVSEKTYHKSGYAVVPVEKEEEDKINDEGEEVNVPEVEKEITQEMRQDAFNDYSTTDDHLMHITGVAENQEGSKFYYVKNSWGTKDKGFDGYWYFSVPFVKLKTVAIMVHKDAIPGEIKTKLGL